MQTQLFMGDCLNLMSDIFDITTERISNAKLVIEGGIL